RNSEQLHRSTGRKFSLSPLGTRSPSSVIAYDFSFLDEGYCIQLHSNSQSFAEEADISSGGFFFKFSSRNECLFSATNPGRVMSEALATSIPPDAVGTALGGRIPKEFSSTPSLNIMSDEVEDGAHSLASFDPMAGDDHDTSKAIHGSDPMIASVGRRKHSADDMKAIHLHRSFSAEDTSCNKENHVSDCHEKLEILVCCWV
ncbi:hypothetical protein GCK32_008203, partial [Trichostrongylus colubriformis]